MGRIQHGNPSASSGHSSRRASPGLAIIPHFRQHPSVIQKLLARPTKLWWEDNHPGEEIPNEVLLQARTLARTPPGHWLQKPFGIVLLNCPRIIR